MASDNIREEYKKESAVIMNRDAVIVRTSVVGIVVNVLLAAFKAVVGLLSHSIAIVMDAVNNLSDALSSIITIIGTKLAGKRPDKKHPMGYGRIEYFTAIIISLIVLYAGVTAFVESVKKIITPETPDYSIISLVIIIVAVIAKILLGTYVIANGRKTNSDSLIASGKDALSDSIISAATVVAAIIYLIFHLSLEAWLGAIISIFIIKSGVEMIRDTISELLGERVDAELSKQVKDAMNSVEGVQGTYDLVMNNYGPDRYIASAHIEIPADMQARELDHLIREIEKKVYAETGVFIGGISIYAMEHGDEEISNMHVAVLKQVEQHPYIKQIHAFHVDKVGKEIEFDAVVDFDEEHPDEELAALGKEIEALYPGYSVIIFQDVDITD